ncbi:MAG TPA: glycosyltransferase family 4 protein [Gemmatimonadaceae bacterium]|nr:glycosyltransferase family 4 protein [Gemmatimonadaceae bacterium]
MTKSPKTFLFVSQVYVPDPAAVGQHLADAAEELAARGHNVIVYTANQGYDDPSVRYPARETVRGVDVRRIPFSSFGKSSILVRLIGGVLFVKQAVLRSFFQPGIDAVVVSTSPPMASLGALIIAGFHRAKVKYWVMDVNPDQIVALGMARPGSLPVRVFNWINREVLRRADDVIVLDRFMAERINAKVDVSEKVAVLPPWPAEDPPEVVAHADNPFRAHHGLDGKTVVMYSGNHGPSNPLETILDAAIAVRDEPRLHFMFIGGGVGKAEVEAAAGSNIESLPYQPQESLKYSLAAADVHLVTMGDSIRGIVHPSKVYGAMAVGRPILLVGPNENHVSDIIDEFENGWHVRHGDVKNAEHVLREIASLSAADLAAMGKRGRDAIQASGGKQGAVGRVCDVLERDV